MSLFIYCEKKNNKILHIERDRPTNFSSDIEHYLIEVNHNNMSDVTVNFNPIDFIKDSSRLYITPDKKVSTYSNEEIKDASDALKTQESKATQVAEATKYLYDTDWVIVKITEMQLEGVDTASLMEKYKEELINRTYYRNLINQLEGDSNE